MNQIFNYLPQINYLIYISPPLNRVTVRVLVVLHTTCMQAIDAGCVFSGHPRQLEILVGY